GPGHASLQEREIEPGKTPRHSGKENRFADSFQGGREMTDVVVGKIAGRRTISETSRSAVKRWCNSELHAFGPQRVVIIRAVDAECVYPTCPSQCFRRLSLGVGNRTAYWMTQHRNFQPKAFHNILEFFDCLLRRVHRDDRGGNDAIRELAILI